MTIAKAITALVVSFVGLVLGEDVSESLNVDAVDAAVVAVLVAAGVYIVPNKPDTTS